MIAEQAYNEAYNFVKAVMPRQIDKLKTYTQNEPLFAHFGIESQIQTAYEREVKLPSGGSIVIDQTEALVSSILTLQNQPVVMMLKKQRSIPTLKRRKKLRVNYVYAILVV